MSSAPRIYDFSLHDLDGGELALEEMRGRVLLLVNTASGCGFTPQYAGLQALHERYKGQGFSVIAFPCNQFRGQEPGSAAEIAAFCATRYGVTFPVTEKIVVNGPHAHPLFRLLKSSAPGVLGSESVKWNFTKFLIDREGHVAARFAPTTKPESLAPVIEDLLAR